MSIPILCKIAMKAHPRYLRYYHKKFISYIYINDSVIHRTTMSFADSNCRPNFKTFIIISSNLLWRMEQNAYKEKYQQFSIKNKPMILILSVDNIRAINRQIKDDRPFTENWPNLNCQLRLLYIFFYSP